MEKELNIYTSLEDAKDEIKRRWNNKELRKKVEDYLGEIPSFFAKEPRAVLHRHIITPDKECMYFGDMAKKLKLSPIGLEYGKDIFLTRNQDKLCLGKMAFYMGVNKNGDPLIECKKVIDLMGCEKKRFVDIETLWGENLVDFHHKLLKKYIPNIETVDVSCWYSENGSCASERYEKFLAFFICHGVLFENFLNYGNENSFTDNVFLPAFKKVQEIMGVNPIIIPAIPEDNLNNPEWWAYDGNIKNNLIVNNNSK